MRALSALRRSECGAAIVELALVAPILSLLAIGVIDMSNAYSRKLALEQGAQRAIEKVMQTTEVDTVEATLATEAVCQVNGLNPDKSCKTAPITASNVTVVYRLECYNGSTLSSSQTSSNAATFDTYTCNSGEREQKYIEVQVTDKYKPMFPIHFAAINSSDKTYHLSAKAGVRTQ